MVGIVALHTLEFQAIKQLWDVVAWVSLVREANQAPLNNGWWLPRATQRPRLDQFAEMNART